MKILTEGMVQARKERREIKIVLTDLAKAFDTVIHKCVMNALRRKRIPSDVRSLIGYLYTDCRSVFCMDGKSTREIRMNSGVKQGCPLSPFLFNIVMDELIDELKAISAGLKVNRSKVPVMAFADDIVDIAVRFRT